MGISIVQYRATIGLHNNVKLVGKAINGNPGSMDYWLDFLFGIDFPGSLLKLIIFILIFNYFLDLLHDCIKFNTFYFKYHVSNNLVNGPEFHHLKNTVENYSTLFSCLVYCILNLLYGFNTLKPGFSGRFKLIHKRLFHSNSLLDRFINMLSLLLLFINLLMIILTIPNIINPGPIDNISVLYHNVRGFVDLRKDSKSELFVSKVKDFHGVLFSQKPDVVILNETWLKKSILTSEIFPNDCYKVFRKDRSLKSHPPDSQYPNKFKRQGGGVLIAIRSDLDIKSVKYKISGDAAKAEILSVTLKPQIGKQVCFTTLYRVGTLGAENFYEVNRHLRSLIKSKPNANHIFMGDINLSKTTWPTGNSCCTTEKLFIDLFQDINFEQLITCPTHKDGKTLDLLLTNNQSIISDLDVNSPDTPCTSDHMSIQFKLNLKTKRLKSTKRKIYNMKKADFKSINSELRNVPWEFILDFDDINKSLNKFEEIFFSICDKYIPKVTVKSSFQPPWFDSELDQICKHKVKLLNKKKQTSDPIAISQIDEEIRKNRKHFRAKFDQKKMDNIINKDDPALIKKKFWSFYKATSNSTRIPSTMNYGKKVRSNDKDVADLFNSYFYEQFSNPSKYDIEIDYRDDLFVDKYFDERTIFDLLIRTNENKAPGPDKITSKLIKFCAKGLAHPLTILYNKIFKMGKIPDKWKLADVVPVFKKGIKSSVTNYRPISLTSLLMKILEYCIKDLLISQCGHLIRENQHGFCPHKSCLTQLLPLVDKFAVALNKKSRIDVIYFDFAKAFDSVNHDLVLHKLKTKFGINGLLLNFLKDYLSNRHQRVLINGSRSDYLPVSSGVPQGSILGPLLFILFIDDICDEISEGTNLELYADDTKLWREILCDNDHFILQNDINRLVMWSKRNLMTFHPDKCKAMAVTNKCLDYPLPFHEFFYELNGCLLDYVQNEKDLGVLFDNKLSWSNHCELVVQKSTKQFNLLRRTCYFMHDSKQKRALYLTLVRIMFEHCCQIWSPQNFTSMIMFDKLQKRAVKWILNEQHESYSDLIFLEKQKELDILPMKHKFIFSDLVLFYRIITKNVQIDLPYYISRLEPQDVKQSTRCLKPVADRIDTLKYKCILPPKVKCFENSYFVRSVKNWNDLPYEIRSTDDRDKFKIMLKDHLWLLLGLKPD